ncbi:MAG TPA: methyltransferase domain-containing protein [Vicinamibacterales bacterium]|nr:methyltransferase domain-containing protein [Vicinamibacterales bacterium]
MKAAPLLALAIAIAPAQLRHSKLPDVKYVPTPQNVVEAMLELAHVTSADVVWDLGSGDGRIPITAAQKYGARGVGVEIDNRLVKEAREHAVAAGVADRVWFIEGDLFDTDFSSATVVTLFLMPKVNQALIPKLKALRPGSRVVSHMWDMGLDWEPDETRDINSLVIHLWTIR